MAAAADVTELLHRFAQGDKQAESDLLHCVYRELRVMARRHLRGERDAHTLQTTALVHEAYLRLAGKPDIPWRDRMHFFAIASRTMRRVLVDYARERRAGKRGAGQPIAPLDEALVISPQHCELLDELDAALEELEKFSPRKAKVVEMRFFGGLSEEEIAEILEVSSRTVKRDWQVAKAWLHAELSH